MDMTPGLRESQRAGEGRSQVLLCEKRCEEKQQVRILKPKTQDVYSLPSQTVAKLRNIAGTKLTRGSTKYLRNKIYWHCELQAMIHPEGHSVLSVVFLPQIHSHVSVMKPSDKFICRTWVYAWAGWIWEVSTCLYFCCALKTALK